MKYHWLSLIWLLVSVSASVSEECDLTSWSGWSDCTANVQCENINGTEEHREARKRLRLIPKQPGPRSLASERVMDDTMSMKQAHMDELKNLQESVCQTGGLWDDQGNKPCDNSKNLADNKPCWNIDQVAFISTKSLMGKYYRFRDKTQSVGTNDVWGWTDPMTGDEWAVVGLTHGTSFVKINGGEPKVLALILSRTVTSNWRDVKVLDDVAYIVSEAPNSGLQLFDLHRLRNLKSFKVLDPNIEMKHFGQAHNLVAHEDRKFIYVVGARGAGFGPEYSCEGGLHIIDVSTRLSPVFVGCYAKDGYTHDAQCVDYRGSDTEFKGKSICFCFNEDTLTIVNVEDPKHPYAISVNIYAGYQYTHQGWLSETHNLLLLDDELDEIYVTDKRTKTFLWDVSNLRFPKLVNTYYSKWTAIDHNQYVKGQFTFQSNYVEGLHILHIDEVNFQLREVAYFDVDPEKAEAVFGGTWSNYPYFKSDIIPVTSIERGLFLLTPQWTNIYNALFNSGSVQNETPSGTSQRRRSYRKPNEWWKERKCQSAILSETKNCTPRPCTTLND